MSQSTRPTLLTIPVEIRQKILRYCFGRTKVKIALNPETSAIKYSYTKSAILESANLTYVCRKIHQESRPILAASTEWDLQVDLNAVAGNIRDFWFAHTPSIVISPDIITEGSIKDIFPKVRTMRIAKGYDGIDLDSPPYLPQDEKSAKAWMHDCVADKQIVTDDKIELIKKAEIIEKKTTKQRKKKKSTVEKLLRGAPGRYQLLATVIVQEDILSKCISDESWTRLMSTELPASLRQCSFANDQTAHRL